MNKVKSLFGAIRHIKSFTITRKFNHQALLMTMIFGGLVTKSQFFTLWTTEK